MRMKKLFSAMLACVIAVGSVSAVERGAVSAVAAADDELQEGDSFVEGNLEYTVLEDGTLSVSCPNDKKDMLTKADIPAEVKGRSVTSIGNSAFDGCTSLTEVMIPDSVTSIGNSAFWNCRNLTTVTIPAGLTKIGYDAFSGCTSLTEVMIPDSVTKIGGSAFFRCTNLITITIPYNVTEIGESAFAQCTSMTSIYVDETNSDFCSENGVLFNKDKTELIQYPAGKADSSYTIPNSVTSIAHRAFQGCSNLTKMTIPESVTFISEAALAGCINLTAIDVDEKNPNYCSVNGLLFNKDKTELIQYPNRKANKIYTIPDSVTIICTDAFARCVNLTTVQIPDSVTIIGSEAFFDCTRLTTVIMPDSVISIYQSAFSDCPNLKDIYYSGTEEQWQDIEIRNYNNKPLTNATIHYESTGPVGTPVEIEIPKPDKDAPEITDMQATATVDGKEVTLTIDDGFLDISDVPDGEFTFTFSAANCAPREYEVTVENGAVTKGLENGVELHFVGDINGDGVVNTQDVARANAHVKGTSTLKGYDLACINVNLDKSINVQDVALMNAHAKNTKLLW